MVIGEYTSVYSLVHCFLLFLTLLYVSGLSFLALLAYNLSFYHFVVQEPDEQLQLQFCLFSGMHYEVKPFSLFVCLSV